MTDTYAFAEKIIEITGLYQDIHDMCAPYRCGGNPDFAAEVSPADIEFERAKAQREAALEGITFTDHPDSFFEQFAVYRKICEKMPYYGTVLFHSSALAVDGEAYLFTAKSGTGKSTHAALWKQLLGDEAVIINDDKPLIHIENGRVTAYGTPWDGKHHLSANISAPVRAVCILERADENRIVPVTKSEALPMLIQQTYRPADSAALERTLALVDSLASSVMLYRLSCTPDIDAARLAYETLRG